MPTISKAVEMQGLLKEQYPELMNNTIVERTEILDLFTEISGKVFEGPDGKYWKLANLTGGLQGIGSRLEGQTLPAGGTPIVINPLINLKYHYARVNTFWQAFRAATAGPAGFADFGTAVLLPCVENLTDDLDRQACGFGAGIVCRVDMAVPTTSLDVDAPFGIASDIKAWLNLKPGMTIVFGPNADGSALRDGGNPATVLTVNVGGNSGGGTVLLDALPAGVADNDYIFRGDQYATNVPVNGQEPEMMGLEGIVDDGTVLDTLQNISRTTTYEWRSPVINANAAPYSGNFTDGLALKAVSDVKTIGGGRPTTFVASHDVARQAFNAVRQLGGFGANRDGAQPVMGAKGVTVLTPMGEFEVRGVGRITPGRCFVLDGSTLIRVKDGDGDWVDDWGGNIFNQMMVGDAIKDGGFAYFRKCMNLGVTDPRKSLKITGVNEAAY